MRKKREQNEGQDCAYLLQWAEQAGGGGREQGRDYNFTHISNAANSELIFKAAVDEMF